MILGYVRCSTVEQAAAGTTTLQEQERVIRGFAMMKGAGSFDVQIFTDPGVSGATPVDKRPAGADLLDAMRKGDVVCASKLDRMFRSAIDALATAEKMKKMGISLVLLDLGPEAVTDNGMAKCFFTMASAFAELERGRIAERMEDGRRGKREKQGELTCLGTAPYGYRIVGLRRDARLEPIPDEQQVIALVKELSGRKRLSQVRRELNHRGLRSRTGKKFQIIQLQRILDRKAMQ